MRFIEGKNNIKKQIPDILYDESRYTSGTPRSVYYPETDKDIIGIVKAANKEKIPVCLIGAQTGITGAGVPVDNSLAICFNQMKKIKGFRTNRKGEVELVCEPGITLEEISLFLESSCKEEGFKSIQNDRLLYPPDPTEISAQLGGTAATNAAGARSFHYGPSRIHINGLKVVLANADTLTIRRGEYTESNNQFSIQTNEGTTLTIPLPSYESPQIKNSAGYYMKKGMDLIDLFIGSEGTLGIFTEITVKLVEKPQIVSGLTFLNSREQAFQFADTLRGKNNILAIEYFDSTALNFFTLNKMIISIPVPDFPPNKSYAVYWEYDNKEKNFEEKLGEWEEELLALNISMEDTWSGIDKKDNKRLKGLRHSIPELINQKIAKIKQQYPEVRKVGTDTVFPSGNFIRGFKQYVKLIEESNLYCIVYGHLGDYHLHFNIIPHDKAEYEKALDVYGKLMKIAVGFGGTISGEHGIGKLKKPYLHMMYNKKELEQMKRIKNALDPQGLLCPGNLF
jgi:D-lactate dehydrogenase (cytochrome)